METTNQPWLSAPREFRLQHEVEAAGGIISFGQANDDIDDIDWNGAFILTATENVIPFKMVCNENFPDEAPIITFTDRTDPKIASITDDTCVLKSDVLNWTKDKSIYMNLKPIYNLLNV